jgi:hypothetical protein
MKSSKLAIYLLATLSVSTTYSQNNSNPWPTTGNVGIGSTTPNFTLQLHGTTDYSVTVPGTPAVYDINGNLITPAQAGYVQNFGRTSRLGLTNSSIGLTNADGLLIRMSGTSGVIENLEKQDLTLSSNNASMRYSGSSNRIWVGLIPGTLTSSTNAYFNISSADNGLFIKNSVSGKYGLSVQSNALTDNAIQVMGTAGTASTFSVKSSGQTSVLTTNISGTSNAFSIGSTTQDYFSVKGNGLVSINYTGAGATDNIFVVSNATQKLLQLSNNGLLRLRKVRVDSDTWADFVFDEDYKLMPLNELKSYLTLNNHLPNVPSASQVQEEGIDLAEMNKTLLQKVEELTLYILQQQEEIDLIKANMSK